jgi:hypothetical protein
MEQSKKVIINKYAKNQRHKAINSGIGQFYAG